MSVTVSDLLNKKNTNFIYFDIDNDDNVIRIGYDDFIRDGELTEKELNTCISIIQLKNKLSYKALHSKWKEHGFYQTKRRCAYYIYSNKIIDTNCRAITLYNGYNYCRLEFEDNILTVEESPKLSNLKVVYTIALNEITAMILQYYKDELTLLTHLVNTCFQSIRKITELSQDTIEYLLQLACITLHNDKREYIHTLHITEYETDKYFEKMNCQSKEMEEICNICKPDYLINMTFDEFSTYNWVATKAKFAGIKQQKLNASNLITNVYKGKKTVSDLLKEYIPIIRAQAEMPYYIADKDLEFYPYWKR